MAFIVKGPELNIAPPSLPEELLLNITSLFIAEIVAFEVESEFTKIAPPR